jgi:hypothetical protein
MKIKFSDNFTRFSKTYLAKFGPNKIFGEDLDHRKNEMNEQQLIARFDEVWEKTLKHLIERAKLSNKEQKDMIYKKLSEASQRSKYQKQNFFNYDDEHREFRIAGIDGVAQLRSLPEVDEYELNQLWFFFGGDTHPDWLIVRFDTVEKREEFEKIAKSLGWEDDSELGKQLVYDFMEKIKRRIE